MAVAKVKKQDGMTLAKVKEQDWMTVASKGRKKLGNIIGNLWATPAPLDNDDWHTQVSKLNLPMSHARPLHQVSLHQRLKSRALPELVVSFKGFARASCKFRGLSPS